jgi:hypothetical protein
MSTSSCEPVEEFEEFEEFDEAGRGSSRPIGLG